MPQAPPPSSPGREASPPEEKRQMASSAYIPIFKIGIRCGPLHVVSGVECIAVDRKEAVQRTGTMYTKVATDSQTQVVTVDIWCIIPFELPEISGPPVFFEERTTTLVPFYNVHLQCSLLVGHWNLHGCRSRALELN